MKKRTILSSFLVLALILSLFSISASAAGSSRSTTNGKADNTLTTSYSGLVSTIDPELFTAQDEDTVLAQVYEPLFLYNNRGELAPYLAEGWTENEDGSVDFVLRSGVQFHSGDTLTAEDVEYSLSRIEFSPVCSAMYGNVVMTITDDTHFTWEFPNGDTFTDIAGYAQALGIVNKSWAEGVISDPNDNLFFEEDGTGPYIFAGIEGNGDITLTKFDKYWGDVSIDTVYFKHLTGPAEVAFESGDLDVAAYSSPENFEAVLTNDNVSGLTQPLHRVAYFILRCGEGEAFEDITLRQAFVYAMNRDDLAYVASDGAGQIAYTLATPLNQYYIDNTEHYDRDLEKSKELLSSLGYSAGNPMHFTILALSSNPAFVSACEILKEELEESYFAVDIEETADTARLYAGDFEAAIHSIGLLPSFASYSLIFDPTFPLNLAGVNNQEILDAFAAAKDESSIQAIMKESTEYLAYVPLFYPANLIAYDTDLNIGEFNTSLTCFLFHEFSWK